MMTVEAQGLDHLKSNNAPVISSPDRVDCLSPGRAIEKPAHLNQDVESWQYFLKIWIFHFFENGFLVVPGENLGAPAPLRAVPH